MNIGICAPSAPAVSTPEDIAKLESGLTVLHSLGYELTITPHCRQVLDYRSATIAERVADLHQLYSDRNVEAIMAASGGRVVGQLLSALDFNLIKNNPKPLIGFSDITLLQNAIWALTNTPSIHGPLAKHFGDNNEQTKISLKAALARQSQAMPTEQFGRFLKGDGMTGRLLGGNLQSVSTLFGTPYVPDFAGAVFLFEEVGEHIGSIDRMLTQFKNAGVWNQIVGIVIGHLEKIKTDYHGVNRDVWEMITEHFTDYNFPILRTELFGHDVPTQLSFTIGGNFTADKSTVVWQ